MKTLKEITKTLEKQKPVLYDRYGVVEIGIFGSFVRGEQTAASDLDILVAFLGPISLLSLVGLENYLSDRLGLRVDIIPREDVRLELRKEIMEETIYV